MKRFLAIVGVLASAYLAWPLWSAWQLRQAVKARDLAALESSVDWMTLRANLKPHIADAVRDNAERSTGVTGVIKRAVGVAVAGRGVDIVVTPKNLARILAGREFVLARKKDGVGVPASGPNDPGVPSSDVDVDDPQDPVPPRRLRWAFFETPTRFRIEAEHPRVPNSRIVSILALQGAAWKLVDVDLVARN